MVVALGVERLLGRLDEIPELSAWSADVALIWIQCAIVVEIAAVYWWVTARWAVSLRWRFGLLDAVYPLGFLILFNLLISSIGSNKSRWFLALGLAAISSAASYIANVRRSAALPENSHRVHVRTFWVPTGVLIIAGIPMFFIAALSNANIIGAVGASGISVLFGVALAVFGRVEYRAWYEAARKEPVPRAAA